MSSQPKSYIACQRIPTSDLTINLPHLPGYLQGRFDYRPDHFELGYSRGTQNVHLLIDFSLYATLRKLNDGFPRKLLPEKDINRLDLFMEQLHGLGVEQSREFVCFNVEQYSAARIRLSHNGKTYQEVQCYG